MPLDVNKKERRQSGVNHYSFKAIESPGAEEVDSQKGAIDRIESQSAPAVGRVCFLLGGRECFPLFFGEWNPVAVSHSIEGPSVHPQDPRRFGSVGDFTKNPDEITPLQLIQRHQPKGGKPVLWGDLFPNR